MRSEKSAKLPRLMLLRRLRRAAPALGALVAIAITASCGGGNGGPTPPPPNPITVTAVSPTTGTTIGGTAITITGNNFVAGATVQVGGAAATDVVVVSPTSITAKTPARAAGAAEVRVSAGAASGALPSAFTFVIPQVGPNTPPTVGALQVTHARANQPAGLATIGDRVTLTVAVNDSETPISQLTYEWTANPTLGTFTGTGASVEWQAPAATTSPQTVLILLTVVEKYQEPDAQGLPVQREHKIQRAMTFKIHDTQKEVGDMAVDFLNLFGDSTKGPELVLHNFSKTCDSGNGYYEESEDIKANRSNFVILSKVIGPNPTRFEYAYDSRQACSNKPSTPGDVCAEVPAQFTDRHLPTNQVNTVAGTAFLTGVYENAEWRLCHSRFSVINTLTGKPVIFDVTSRGIVRVPNQP
jgi:hypothetical protein